MVEVVFVKDVQDIARKGAVKQVADGYARNFLFPRGLAVIATPQLIAQLEAEKQKRTEELEIRRADYEKLVEKLEGTEVEIVAKANNKGNLFAALEAEAIARKLGKSILARHVIIDEPIKTVGEHTVKISPLAGLTATIKVTVKSE